MNNPSKKGRGQMFTYHDSTDSDVVIESNVNQIILPQHFCFSPQEFEEVKVRSIENVLQTFSEYLKKVLQTHAGLHMKSTMVKPLLTKDLYSK